MNKEKLINIVFISLELIGSSAFFIFSSYELIFEAIQILMFTLCLQIPLIVKQITKETIRPLIIYIFYIFLILHFILGEICAFYIKMKYYDVFLHFLSSFLICFLGYGIIHYYLNNKHIVIQKTFSCMFALSSEFLWEIIEYIIDDIFKTNMQRYIDLSGHLALCDTIKDMYVSLIGCVLFLIVIINNKVKNFKIKSPT